MKVAAVDVGRQDRLMFFAVPAREQMLQGALAQADVGPDHDPDHLLVFDFHMDITAHRNLLDCSVLLPRVLVLRSRRAAGDRHRDYTSGENGLQPSYVAHDEPPERMEYLGKPRRGQRACRANALLK